MKTTGIVRKVDNLGRIVIPKEIRRILNIVDDKDFMEIFLDGERIILNKYAPACLYCGSADDLIEFRGNKICAKCADEIYKIKESSK